MEPGQHYIVANGEKFAAILLNFKAGKTYYLEQEKRIGFALPRTNYILVKGDRLYNDLKGHCSCYGPDPHNPGRDLDEETLAGVIAAYGKDRGNVPANEIEPGK